MRVAALSDFHIGAYRHADTFRHDLAAFMAFLDRLEATHDSIVLLGDIYQTEHSPIPGRAAARRQLTAARRRVRPLAERLERPPYVYIYGNHDAVARDELGARESLRIERDGFAVFFIHGHQFDPVLRRAYPAARFGTWITGQLRSLGLRRIAGVVETKDIEVKHERFKGKDGPYAAAARHLMTTHRADAVVMGHTHVGVRDQLTEGVMANTGSCSNGAVSYVSIDTSARSVELRQGRRGRAVVPQ